MQWCIIDDIAADYFSRDVVVTFGWAAFNLRSCEDVEEEPQKVMDFGLRGDAV